MPLPRWQRYGIWRLSQTCWWDGQACIRLRPGGVVQVLSPWEFAAVLEEPGERLPYGVQWPSRPLQPPRLKQRKDYPMAREQVDGFSMTHTYAFYNDGTCDVETSFKNMGLTPDQVKRRQTEVDLPILMKLIALRDEGSAPAPAPVPS